MNAKRWVLRAVLLFIITLAQATPAQAEVVISNGAFRNRVNQCFELFGGADSETKEIIDTLMQPAPAPRHTIQQGAVGPGNLAATTATNPGQSRIQPGGGRGRGSGSTVTMGPGIPADQFCAILLHEFKHAYDYNNGADRNTQPPRPKPGAGIPDAEIDAMREENRYRKHAGLPQERNYDGIPLPADAIFD